MDWYLLKTWTGREDEMVKEIRRTVPPGLYQDCFVITQERMEEAAEKYCPCGTSVSGMCVSYLYRKWGFFFETFGASAGYKQENGLQRTGVFSCNERRCRVLGQNIREGSRGQAFLCREK